MVSTTHTDVTLPPAGSLNAEPVQEGAVSRVFAAVLGAVIWLPKKLIVSYGEYLLMHYSWGGPVCTTRRK